MPFSHRPGAPLALTRRRLLAVGAAGLGAFALPIGAPNSANAATDAYAALRSSWATSLSGGAIDSSNSIFATALAGLNAEAEAYLSTLESGSGITSLWPDLPLGSASANLTSTFNRLLTLALAYVTPGTDYTGSSSLATSIVDALTFMVTGPYASTVTPYGNWWDWQIGSTHALEDAAVLMYGELSSTLISDIWSSISGFVTSPSAQMIVSNGKTTTATGANLLDLCRAWIIAGTLTETSSTISTAVSAISAALPFVMCGGNGLYSDYSCVFHSGVAYTGSYGAVEWNDLQALVALLVGSTWAITDSNLANYADGVTYGLAPMVYNGLMLDSVRGRAISRYAETDSTDGFNAALILLGWAGATTDSTQAAAWKATAKGWLQRNTVTTISATTTVIVNTTTGATVTTSAVGVAAIASAHAVLTDSSITAAAEPEAHNQFPNMARAVHRRPGWAYSISMCSDNIMRYEVINSENLQGWYTGDGMGQLYLDGDIAQYNDEFWCTVDPYLLPGVTADQGTLANSAGANTFPATKWVGGSVLGGVYGALGMQLKAYSTDLAGYKSWFCLDDAVVCLGAGITSTSGNTVLTTVENRNLHSIGSNDLYINGTEQSISAGWSSTVSAVHSACITGVAGYYFLWSAGANNIEFALTNQTGAWSDINISGLTTSETRPYLSIAFNHGTDPSGATYSYVVLPNATETETAAYAASPSVSVVSNTATVQAITDSSLGVTMANFFAAGTAGSITVNAPASVSVQQAAGELTIAVSDPTWTASTVEVTVAASGFTSLVSASDGLTVLSATSSGVTLLVETGGSRGATFTATLSTSGTAATTRTATMLAPTGDTYVRGGTYAATNYSTTNTMVVKNSTGAYDRVALLQFDTSSISGTVKRAILWLNGFVSDSGGSQTTLTAYELSSSSWSASTVTFDTAPTLSTALGSGQISDLTDWVGLDVTAAVQTGTGAVTALGVWQESTSTCLATVLYSSVEADYQTPVLEVIV
ncbi:MAG TPA: polysaccharide lyase family 8 super-sandwich domain-containing protein [Actinospica sp.]|jgi:hyaluronate lyase|nr:polysaccharide lyase family 8 super-sandwich domain-containing protein [Actinospica sp.]